MRQLKYMKIFRKSFHTYSIKQMIDCISVHLNDQDNKILVLDRCILPVYQPVIGEKRTGIILQL